MNIAVTTAGAWGTAIALHLQRLGHTVTLLPHTPEEALSLASERENKAFFPGHKLPRDLQIALQPGPALMEADLVLLACPSKFLRALCQKLKPHTRQQDAWQLKGFVVLCKGLEPHTCKLPTQVVAEELPDFAVAALSGPTFADQVAQAQPSALVMATEAEESLAQTWQTALSGPTFRVYRSHDLVGVQLGGSLKNVYAIAAGVVDGLGYRDNAKAALLTRSLAEMVRLGVSLGGQAETFYGLSGFGDLILTCNGQSSRNRTFGQRFARGESIERLIEQEGMTVEGYSSCRSYFELCQEKGLDMPILAQIHAVLYEGVSPQEALMALMTRELKPEFS